MTAMPSWAKILAHSLYIRPVVASTEQKPCTPIQHPILFIHGGGLTGAQWECTPDRRPGWAVLASGAGYPVYILDGVDSGRSQGAPAAARQGPVEHRTAKEVWARFRFGPEDTFDERQPFAGSQAPVEHLDALVGSQAARRRTTDEVEIKGIIAAIQEIGACIVIAHSHGAALIMDALDLLHPLIHRLILVEPGETAVASKLLATTSTLLVWGDYIDDHPAWLRINKPYKHAPVDVLHLPAIGVRGNSHFPMLDRNSSNVFAHLLQWLEQNADTKATKPG